MEADLTVVTVVQAVRVGHTEAVQAAGVDPTVVGIAGEAIGRKDSITVREELDNLSFSLGYLRVHRSC